MERATVLLVGIFDCRSEDSDDGSISSPSNGSRTLDGKTKEIGKGRGGGG